MKRLLSILLFLVPLWLMAAPPPPYRPNFFDTNVNPRVIVAAGTNVTVQYTTTGTDIRTYTVNSSGGGGTGQTNWDYTAITNAPWQWGSQNLTNWSQLSTNLLQDLDQTNWPYTSITNAPWQWGSQNLTNWSQLSTNDLAALTNGYPWTNLTVAIAGAVTNGYPWTNLTVAHASAVTNGYPWTNIYSPGISGGSTNQVYTQTGWSGYPQVTNLSLITNGLGTAIVPTLWLTNPTPAALGAQQNSPALAFSGQGWRSGNSTTMPCVMESYLVPVQGSSANPTFNFLWASSVAGVAPTTALTLRSDGRLSAAGDMIAANFNTAGSGGYYGWSGRLLEYSPSAGDVQFIDTGVTYFNRMYLGPANALWPALKVESTNAPTLSIRTGADANYASLVASNITAVGTMFTANMIVTNNLTLNGTLTVSNITGNFVHSLYATNGYTVCTTAKDVYLVNAYTNPMFVLPDATTVKGQEFIFSTTNRGAFFIVTNATGAQPVADGTSLSYTNTDNGLKVVRFISDGSAWWLSSKGRVTLPCASWSCSTNTTFANVTNSITLNTVEMNNLSGIYLDNSAWFTAGVGSRMWVTNPGVYMITFSAVWSKVGGGAANGDIWLRQNGTDLPRTMTLQTIQNSSTTNVMTVNFMLPVTGVTYFDLQGASPDGSAQLQAMPAITSPFNRPACPSIIVTLNKTSD